MADGIRTVVVWLLASQVCCGLLLPPQGHRAPSHEAGGPTLSRLLDRLLATGAVLPRLLPRPAQRGLRGAPMSVCPASSCQVLGMLEAPAPMWLGLRLSGGRAWPGLSLGIGVHTCSPCPWAHGSGLPRESRIPVQCSAFGASVDVGLCIEQTCLGSSLWWRQWTHQPTLASHRHHPSVGNVHIPRYLRGFTRSGIPRSVGSVFSAASKLRTVRSSCCGSAG